MAKQRIHTIKNKILVRGDENLLTNNEILVSETPEGVSLKERTSEGIKTISGGNGGGEGNTYYFKVDFTALVGTGMEVPSPETEAAAFANFCGETMCGAFGSLLLGYGNAPFLTGENASRTYGLRPQLANISFLCYDNYMYFEGNTVYTVGFHDLNLHKTDEGYIEEGHRANINIISCMVSSGQDVIIRISLLPFALNFTLNHEYPLDSSKLSITKYSELWQKMISLTYPENMSLNLEDASVNAFTGMIDKMFTPISFDEVEKHYNTLIEEAKKDFEES